MTKYKLRRDLFNNGEIIPAGKVIEVADEARAQELLERGTVISLKDAKAAEQPAKITGEVVETVTVDETEYNKVVNAEGTFYTANGAEVTEDAFTAAKQTNVKQEIEAGRDAAPVTSGEVVQPQPPLDQPPAPVDLSGTVPTPEGTTPEQIQQDLENTGASSTPQNDVQEV